MSVLVHCVKRLALTFIPTAEGSDSQEEDRYSQRSRLDTQTQEPTLEDHGDLLADAFVS